MLNLTNIFAGKQTGLSKEGAAELLKVKPELLDQFEAAYRKAAITEEESNGNFFRINSRMASEMARTKGLPNEFSEEELQSVIKRIEDEIDFMSNPMNFLEDKEMDGRVTNEELRIIPVELRPQLTGSMCMCDINSPSYPLLLMHYQMYLEEQDPKKKMMHYHMFRQGLDILDLDSVTYEMLGMNRNSMGYWFPALSFSVQNQSFFKIPKTKIIKVPLPILQLTRCDYMSLTPTTLQIVDDWAMKAFDLDVTKEYFVKTGTYSSKFDFRNCRVAGEQEVRELGEYLLFIHNQANMMASPLNNPVIYGVSTTNEWVVREFIPDVENNPCIYHGMPLHTEFRFFVDLDADEILGVSPYWEPNLLKHRFSKKNDANSPHSIHDYVIIKAHEKTMMKRYHEHLEEITNHLQALIPDMHLSGQWSIDIMLNGNDVWIIDMATADTSALKECCGDKLVKQKEDWIPRIGENYDDLSRV